MKTSKRILALMLSALMIFSVVIIPGADLSLFGIEADAADSVIISDGNGFSITQQRVVSNYESLYNEYRNRFFTGRETNQPTNFVIPGLASTDDYTPQGMTYWHEKEWILISAYDASGKGRHSVIYAIDAVTTKFVALYKILNANGTVNTSHGGGIAASEYNFYYADSGSKISYIPLKEMEMAEGETVKTIRLQGSIDCSGELYGGSSGSAATSYCCYDEGVLWTGNFYFTKDENHPEYGYKANVNSDSILLGYKLAGNSSEEEWYYLSKNFNLLKLNYTTERKLTYDTGTMTFTTLLHDGANAEIRGKITSSATPSSSVFEYTTASDIGTFHLDEGKTYKIEYIADNPYTDIYMWSPVGTHCNVGTGRGVALGDGRYHYEMIFTAGLKPSGCDSGWPTTQSTNGSYTGTYNFRFDQDTITGNREFNITDLSVSAYAEAEGFTPDSKYEGIGCAGNPTYVVALKNIDRVQYAMVDKGKIYISRSWSRTESANHIRELVIGDMDIFSPGTETLVINGRQRKCHTVSNNTKTFSGTNMFYMGEALCVIGDYLYMFGEGAAWNYNGKESNKCTEPIDVIWKIDQYAIVGENRPIEEVSGIYYEKVTNVADIVDGEEYIIVYESEEKDPVTQMNYLYALDSYGGYGGHKLPKKASNNLSVSSTGGSIGAIGYEFHNYSEGYENDKEAIYVSQETDAKKSIHWTLKKSGNGFHIINSDYYYSTNKYLVFNNDVIAMSDTAEEVGIVKNTVAGKFQLYTNVGGTSCYLWCNDGKFSDTYSNYYKNHGITAYLPNYNGLEEVDGTFHMYTNSGNSASNLVAGLSSNYGNFDIYRKVPDPYSTTAETRVFTDMNAELQKDGTYTVRLETYATSPVQYQTVAQRPTDFIIAIDNTNSSSLSKDDENEFDGFHRHDKFDLLAAAGNSDVSSHTKKGETGSYQKGNMWVQHTDGIMCKVNCDVKGDGSSWFTHYQYVYLYYTHPTGETFWFYPNPNDTYGQWKTGKPTDSQAMRIGATDQDGRRTKVVYSGVCYEWRTNSARLSNMQIAANQLIWKIQNEANSKNIDHRVAVASGNGLYVKGISDPVAHSSLNATHCQNAFYSVSEFNSAKDIIHGIKAQHSTSKIEDIVLTSNSVADKSGTNYFADGERNLCLIILTDAQSIDNTIANNTIPDAKEGKQNKGSYIYTIQINENSSTFNGRNTNQALNYISSNYLVADSLNSPGEKNVKDIEFALSVNKFADDTAVNDFVSTVYNSVISNSENALAKLNTSSIIREQIADVFYTSEVEDINIKTYTADSFADGLGRISFKAPVESSSVTVDKTKIKTDKTITATGFDYTANYVDSAHTGKKLIIEISGLLANPNYEFNNENITVHENTAIYQNQTFLNKQSPIKHYPQENFTIPEYTYVLDYGIGMLDTDVNGTLISISQQPTKQGEYVGHLAANNVTMQVRNWLDLIYGLKPSVSDADSQTGYDHSSGYCLIQRDDGTYDWFKINIKPASNVYFEEFIETKITNTSYADWVEEGSKKTGLYQTLTGEDTVYGYDSNYLSDNSKYSYGSAYKSQVDANNLRSETISFDYTGTAVDIVASCGVDTGIYIVTIKENGVAEKAYIVDTYFTDSNVLNGVSQINQVPIVHHENKYGYGTYTAEVTSVYLSSIVGGRTTYAMNRFGNDDVSFYSRDITEEAKEAILQFADMEYLLDTDIEVVFCDENSVLNGGTGVEGASGGMATFGLRGATATATKPLTNYFDGYRIYKPLGDNETDYVQTEQGSQYFNVINSLVSTDDIINGSETGFVGYIVGDGSDETKFADYKKNGPANEVYLAAGNDAVAFTAPEEYERVMVSLRAVNGSPKAKIGGKEFAITSNTEMYYDVTDYIQDGTIAIQNSGSGLLAVNNIKLVSGHAIQPFMMFNMSRIRMMMAAPAEEVEPNLPAETPNEGGSWPTDIPYTEPFPTPEEPSTEPETPDVNDGAEEEKGFIEQITENFTKLLNMIQSMLDKIVNLLKSLMA